MDIKDSTTRNYIWTFLRKYKALAITFVTIPLILNVACYFSIPFFNNAGSSAWLSFWGGYLGSTIMVGITLYVLQEQLKQNQKENRHNRDNNRIENESNRLQSQKIRLQEIELKWFDDLKQACLKLYTAFDNNDVIIASDLDPFTEIFNSQVTQLIARMNEAYFNFHLVVNYHKNIVNTTQVQKIQQFVDEYLSLLSDMNYLHVYAILLRKNLESIDIESREEFNSKCKDYINKYKNKMEIPEITTDRVWDLLLENNFDDIKVIPQILGFLIKRIDNFKMLEVDNSLTELLKAEYKKATVILSNGN